MDLVGIVENPIPRGPRASFFYGRDGAPLRYARWRPSVPEMNGTVCLFQGRGEFIEKYFETIEDLRKRGFNVITMDWRGQGRSARLLKRRSKSHIDHFFQYEDDLAAFMEQVVLPECPAPFFALGQSMGGNILLRAAANRSWFTRVVVLAPLVDIAPRMLPRWLVRGVTQLFNYLGFGEAFAPGGSGSRPTELGPFSTNLVTSDRTRYERTRRILEAEPDLGVGGPTIGWIDAAFTAMDRLKATEFPTEVKVPILMFSAGYDRVVSNRAIEDLSMVIPATRHIVIRGARHEILMESDFYREQFWAAFDAFVPGVRRSHPAMTSSASS